MKLLKHTLIFMMALVLMVGSVALAEEYQGQPPTEFDQAPMLDEKVEEGELPPVEERLPVPEDAYVVEPNEKVGSYGGTIRTAGIKRFGGDTQLVMSSPMLIKPNPEGNDLVPHVAKKVEESEDATTFTIHLREGMKWSDGHPFTSEDIMFWYKHYLQNKELTPYIAPEWRSKDGELMEMTAPDDYTIQIKFKNSKPFFLRYMYMNTSYWNMITPAHYLKQFHVDFVEEEKLVEMAEEEGFDAWYELFLDKYENHHGMTSNPDLPTLSAFRPVEFSSTRQVYERNPYYYKVDTEGNQLPYVDRVVYDQLSDVEVIQGKIMSGELDFAGFNNKIQNYPMYRQYEKEGGYNTVLWKSGFGSEVIYQVNLNHKDEVLREIFQDVRFRRALSLGINREEINKAIYYDKGEEVQYTVLPSSRFYEEEFAEAYVDYKPEKAKELLAEMGLEDSDGDDWLERPDGKDLTFTIEYFPTETPKTPNVELVTEHWRELGIKVEQKQISAELAQQRAPANMMDATVWHGDKATDLRFQTNLYFVPRNPAWSATIWSEWARWNQTDGESGEEPPAEIKEILGWYKDMTNEPNLDKRIELGKKILAKQAENLWAIGTIGRSPWPIVVDKNLRNVPQDGYWCWDTLWTMSRDPEQFFFEED